MSDDGPYDPKDTSNPAKAPKPRDAATLILIRRTKAGPEVLMGQRAKGHVFMPNKWVFPGGRVDVGDARAAAATELAPETEADLRRNGVRRLPRAFALAAVRETFEEAGLVVGRRGAEKPLPELHKLTYVARAITPPYRPKRFDARFFLADAEDVLADDRPVSGDEELLDTRWLSLEETAGFDLPNVTRFVIGEVRARLAGEALRPVFLRYTKGGHRTDRL